MKQLELAQAVFFLRPRFSRGGNRAAPLSTHLLRICAGALRDKRHWRFFVQIGFF